MVPEKGMKFKHYTYKITFPGMPWYYWGVHTDNGKPYYGSPTTHKWIWKFYECEIQILEWFDDRKEAERVEDRLIKATIRDPNCLNEHWGGSIPVGDCSENGKKGAKTNLESGQVYEAIKKAHETLANNPEIRKEVGRRNVETGQIRVASELGLKKLRENPELRRNGGRKGGSTQGRRNAANGHMGRIGSLGAAAQHSRRFMCTVTHKVSTVIGLNRWQKKRNIDFSNRVEVYPPDA
jgi:hypothetical protein